MTRPRSPISTYSPILLRTLIQGSKSRHDFTMPFNEASHLRQRMHQLRDRMRRESHELYPIIAKAKIRITWDESTTPTKRSGHGKFPLDPKSPVTLTIAPHDTEFESILQAGGIDLTTPIDALDTLTQGVTPAAGGSLDDWLAGIEKKATEEK